MFQRFYTIAMTTFVETIRQPIYGVLLAATGLLLILNVSLAAFTLEDDNKLLLDLGLSTLMLSGLFLSAFSAAGVLSREIENKTVLTVVSKPISRSLFILGKFAGLAAALLLAFYLGTLVFILAIRHGVLESTADPWDAPVLVFGFGSLTASLIAAAFCNYFYGKHFATMVLAFLTPLLTLSVLLVGKFDEHFDVIPFGSNFVGGQVLIAAYFVLLVVLLTAGVALAASTRLGQTMTLVVCTGFICVGLVSDYAFSPYAVEGGLGEFMSASFGSKLGTLAYHVVPNLGPFWVIDGLYAESLHTAIPAHYVGYVSGYALLLLIAAVGLAIALFENREVG